MDCLFFEIFRPHYNLNLHSISINGQLLPIDPAAFSASNNRETIVDSGTTLTYLVEEAYDPFVSAVSLTFSFYSSVQLWCGLNYSWLTFDSLSPKNVPLKKIIRLDRGLYNKPFHNKFILIDLVAYFITMFHRQVTIWRTK